eukprot:2269832-Pleurochrysis_carterae.AAC.1
MQTGVSILHIVEHTSAAAVTAIAITAAIVATAIGIVIITGTKLTQIKSIVAPLIQTQITAPSTLHARVTRATRTDDDVWSKMARVHGR